MPLPRVTMECRTVADPELRFSQSGTAVVRMRTVASDRKRNDAGEWEDGDQLWMDVTCFGKLAENVAESVEKGDLLLVHGRFRTEEWNDRDSGEKRTKVAMIADVVASSLQFRVIPHGTQSRAADRPAARPAPQQEEPPF